MQPRAGWPLAPASDFPQEAGSGAEVQAPPDRNTPDAHSEAARQSVDPSENAASPAALDLPEADPDPPPAGDDPAIDVEVVTQGAGSDASPAAGPPVEQAEGRTAERVQEEDSEQAQGLSQLPQLPQDQSRAQAAPHAGDGDRSQAEARGEAGAPSPVPLDLNLPGVLRPLAPGPQGEATPGSLGLRVIPMATVESKPAETSPTESETGEADRSSPEVIESVAPVYPLSARLAGIQGTVYLEVEVGADGIPQKAGVARSSGNADLDAAALDAVMRWRFSPARQDGRPVPSQATVAVEFRLADS